MRVVVDTNVLISAALKDHTPPRNSIIWIRGHGQYPEKPGNGD